jgi:hypothetical protein
LPEIEDFDILVSLADIPRESTFSAFPGITAEGETLLAGASAGVYIAGSPDSKALFGHPTPRKGASGHSFGFSKSNSRN